MTVTEILSVFGLTTDIARAVAAAEMDPTSENIKDVVTAYARNGQTVPAQLMAHLIQINEERHPEDTVRGAVAPYLFFGGAIILFLMLRR